ncbi:hypothetical protein ACWCPX_46150 [Streptomyces olivaceoviridis]
MTDILLAAVLGCAVLGIVVVYRGHRRNAAKIAQLQAEVTAAKILALQQAAQQTAAPGPDEADETCLADEPEPVRRKRHLSLYLGGLAAAFTWLGSRLRNTWRHHHVATASAVVVATAATAAAAYHITSSDGGAQTGSRAQSPASAPHIPGATDSNSPAPSDSASGNNADTETQSRDGIVRVDEPKPGESGTPVHRGPARTIADIGGEHTPGSGTPTGDQTPGESTPSTPATTMPSPPAPPTTPAPPTPPAPPTHAPTAPPTTPPPAPPSTPPASPPTPPDSGHDPGCTIHIRVPPIDICI